MDGPIQLFLLEPGHFHACWLICDLDERLNPTVKVAARPGFDLVPFDNWCSDLEKAGVPLPRRVVKIAHDPLEPILDFPGPKIVAMAGQNHLKANRIAQFLSHGVHVVCDKPMWTDPVLGLPVIEQLQNYQKPAFLDDLMTEAGEPAFVLQREILRMGLDGLQLRPKNKGRMRIHLGNHHHLVKSVGGVTVKRGQDFLDWHTYGDPFADVGVHLVDLLFGFLASAGELDFSQDSQSIGRVESQSVWLDRETFERVEPVSFPPGETSKRVQYPIRQTWNGEGRYEGIRIEVSWAAANDPLKPEGQFCAIPVEAGGLAAMKTEGDPCVCLHLVGIPVIRRADFAKIIQDILETMPDTWAETKVEINRYGIRVVPDPRVRVGHPLRFSRLLSRFLDRLEGGISLTPTARQALIEKYRISAGLARA